MEYQDFFVGGRICLLRTAKAMTQEQLAEVLKISPAAVSKWERNLANPSIEMLWRLADFFDCTIDELVGRRDVREANDHEKEKLRLTAIAEDLQKCAEISRAEGLIAMEEAVPSMEGGSRFLSFAVSYINYLFMKQIDLERTFEFLDNYVATLPEAERTEGSMVARTLKLIFTGERPEIIQEYIASCIGMEYREKKGGMNKVLKQTREEILSLYRDKPKRSDATGLLECFSAVGDYEIQTLLRNLDSGTLAAALAGASGVVATRFLSNMPDWIQYVISEDIQNFTGSEEEILEAQRRVLECNF